VGQFLLVILGQRSLQQHPPQSTARGAHTDDLLRGLDVALALRIDGDDGQSLQLHHEITLHTVDLVVRGGRFVVIVVADDDQIGHVESSKDHCCMSSYSQGKSGGIIPVELNVRTSPEGEHHPLGVTAQCQPCVRSGQVRSGRSAAAKAQMTGGTADGVALPGGGTVAVAVRGRAQVRTALRYPTVGLGQRRGGAA